MRGPLLSGPIGSAAALAALGRWTVGLAPVVVLGPPWLGRAVVRQGEGGVGPDGARHQASGTEGAGPAGAGKVGTFLLVEPSARPIALRALRRARKEGQALEVALGGAELPLRRGGLPGIVVENAAGLPAEDVVRWLAALVPCLRPGGRLIALDGTTSTAAAARVAGAFLSAALTGIVQEWPREGAVLTVGSAPPASIVAARFGLPA